MPNQAFSAVTNAERAQQNTEDYPSSSIREMAEQRLNQLGRCIRDAYRSEEADRQSSADGQSSKQPR
jgi:hypothetical protein